MARWIPVSRVWRRQKLAAADAAHVDSMRHVRPAGIRDSRHDFPRHADAADDLVPGDVVDHQPTDGCKCSGIAGSLGAGQLRDSLDLAAQVAPRDGATGARSVDWPSGSHETYLGGLEEGVRGRQTHKKVLIAVAAEEDGEGIGRIRMRRIPDASANSLEAFVFEAVAPGGLLHTDGLLSYDRLEKRGYQHRITFLKGRRESTAELLPRVHRVVSLLKRWLLGTHQGAVSHAHLDYYLDEFTFRFNRRTSRHRGKLFYRLVEQAVAVGPAPYTSLVKHVRSGRQHQRLQHHH